MMNGDSHLFPPPRISFCTTCANRVDQLKQVYWHNAKKILDFRYVEWVILNYGSRDSLDQFMRSALSSSSSRIIYATTSVSPGQWHASKAKNMAHFAASGDILCNLDCDNRIGNAIEIIMKFFNYGCKILHMPSGVFRDGTYGRIAIDRDLFSQLGGYDASFYPMGYQDTDILVRASLAGYHILHSMSATGYAVKNTKIDSIKYCKIEGLSWEDYDQLNRELAYENVLRRQFKVNVKSTNRQPALKTIRGDLP